MSNNLLSQRQSPAHESSANEGSLIIESVLMREEDMGAPSTPTLVPTETIPNEETPPTEATEGASTSDLIDSNVEDAGTVKGLLRVDERTQCQGQR